MQFIDLDAQYKQLKSKIDTRIQKVLDHGQYIMGPEVNELEDKLSEYVGVKHAISCANGTDALTLSLMALEIGKGDAVFCPTFTFFATAEAISFLGAQPIFVDSDPSSFNICIKHLEAEIENTLLKSDLKPKAIIAVDLFGLPANYERLEVIAAKYNLKLIEDAAQGFGGEIKGRRTGSFGDIATTSFFPAKPLGCYGDGGALFTNNDEYAEIIRSLRVHGKGKHKYDNVRIGMNSRLDTIQAAILIEKLEAFPVELKRRNNIASYYSQNLDERYNVPQVPLGYLSSWAQYTLTHAKRDSLREFCENNGIPTAVYYLSCMHQQSVYQDHYKKTATLENAENLSSKVISLPMHPYLSDEELNSIVEVVNSFIDLE